MFLKKVFGCLAVAMLFFALTQTASAGPLPCVNTVPSMQEDGRPVCASIPGLGSPLILPSADFVAPTYWEDLHPLTAGRCSTGLPGDCDYDDAKVLVTGDYATRRITLEFAGSLAAYLNTVGVVGTNIWVNRNSVGPVSTTINWVPGAELVLYDTTSVGTTWFSGDGDHNLGDDPHAIVRMTVSPPPTVPEPTTFLLLGGGFVTLGLWRRRATRT